MKHGSLFSGIGGFDLAAEWMGWENVFHCELNEFGQKVLKHYWPNADSYTDITKTNFKKYEGTIDIISGGFPCQPFSTAGKRKGTNDERYLWHEMLRAIQEIKPKFIIAENVFGITNINGGLVFEQVCLDLENEGYEVQPFIIAAASKNAPHRRDRCWIVAHNNNTRNTTLRSENNGSRKKESIEWKHSFNEFSGQGNKGNATNTISIRGNENDRITKSNEFDKNSSPKLWEDFPTQSPVCGRDDGISTKLDGITFSKWRNESIKAYGNAIVPQIAYELFKVIDSMNL